MRVCEKARENERNSERETERKRERKREKKGEKQSVETVKTNATAARERQAGRCLHMLCLYTSCS